MDTWKYNNEELAAMAHALESVSVRSKAGNRLLDELIMARANRQRQKAEEEDWTSSRPYGAPDWSVQ